MHDPHHDHHHHEHEDRNFTVHVEQPSQCKRLLIIEIPVEEVEKEEAVVFRKLRSDLKIPGFRKGKLPEKYIWKNYADVIHSDAVQNLLPQIFEMALMREKIAAVGDPSFENIKGKKGEPITIEVSVEVRPEVRIERYHDIEVHVEKKEVGETDVLDALERLRQRMATYKVVSRPAGPADLVIIDYAPILENGLVDEKKYLRNYPIDLSSSSVLPEFISALAGVGTGEEKDVEVHYPNDFPEKELAGTIKKFHVRVREIKEKLVPELTDDFVRQLGSDFSSLEDLRKRVKDDLIDDESKRVSREIEERVIDEILRNEPFDVPDVMVENYLRSVIEEDKKRRPHIASDEERENEIRELFHEAAVRTVKKYFVVEAIKKQENIEVTPEELKARIDDLAGSGESGDPIRQYFEHPEHRSRLENEIKDEKTLRFLREAARVKAA